MPIPGNPPSDPLQVVYEDYQMVQLTVPYLSGYLGFREVPFLLQGLETLRCTQPALMPQILMVDGNGTAPFPVTTRNNFHLASPLFLPKSTSVSLTTAASTCVSARTVE